MKKVLITGGGRGIGRALAEALVNEGCEVLICGRNAADLQRAHEELGVHTVVADITDAADVARIASVVRAELSGLDILVNNAGIQCSQDVAEGIDMALAEREIAVNLTAPIALTSALMPLLQSSEEAVVANVTSGLALAPSRRSPIYATTKAALAQWGHALRLQLEGSSVRVVEILPPVVATQMTTGRQADAISPNLAARAIVKGFRAGRRRILIGKTRALVAIHRVSPALARRIVANK